MNENNMAVRGCQSSDATLTTPVRFAPFRAIALQPLPSLFIAGQKPAIPRSVQWPPKGAATIANRFPISPFFRQLLSVFLVFVCAVDI